MNIYKLDLNNLNNNKLDLNNNKSYNYTHNTHND